MNRQFSQVYSCPYTGLNRFPAIEAASSEANLKLTKPPLLSVIPIIRRSYRSNEVSASASKDALDSKPDLRAAISFCLNIWTSKGPRSLKGIDQKMMRAKGD
jgi:hypothetical protein